MRPPLLENILAQPEALRAVASYQLGAGREALMRSAELLRGSREIVVSGMGASLFASIPLSYVLGEKRAGVSVVETSDLLYFRLSSLGASTAVILVSRSGESVEVTRLLPLLKARGCRVIGVMNVADSTLARESDAKILLNSPADQLVAIQTYSATLAALALLGAAYRGELEAAKRELDESIPKLERSISECLATSGEWSEFVQGEAPLYVLGRGPSLASVNAGVLLMHEVAKRPAVGMPAAQFRHGPVEVVSKDFGAVVFGSQAATAKLDRALAEDLARIGGTVRWVGPEAGREVTALGEWPDGVPQRFASLFEVVPMQFLAYETAKSRNIPIGQFRFAPAVTLSETGLSNPASAP